MAVTVRNTLIEPCVGFSLVMLYFVLFLLGVVLFVKEGEVAVIGSLYLVAFPVCCCVTMGKFLFVFTFPPGPTSL